MRIFPLGDNALTVEFGNLISVDLNRKAIALGELISSEPFPGFIEVVPSYSSVTIFYDPHRVRDSVTSPSTSFEAVKAIVERAIGDVTDLPEPKRPIIEIPVSFDEEDALDLNDIAESKGLSRDEFIEIFLSKTYRVYMIGFLPGFAYMGEVDERITVPRRVTPRMKVPKGSVGIAGTQTGIYPLESPGGWQIIGRTEVEMFSVHKEPLCFLNAGDIVRFIAK